MRIIILTHQENSLGYSMARYTKLLREGMQYRGHDVEVWGPKLYLSNVTSFRRLKKWMRYIDLYVLFPFFFKKKCKRIPPNTLFVLIDQALGIWMSFLKSKKHVVHCHDFIALNSALGKIEENPLTNTGRLYQRLILNGFLKSKFFISISKNTQKELNQVLKTSPSLNVQVYNALDPIFVAGSVSKARSNIGTVLQRGVDEGYLLHVGGNTFYKNRLGVLKIYNAWRERSSEELPLLMIGSPITQELSLEYERSPFKKDIHFLVRIEDKLLVNAYQGAKVFVFPSLEEGFGFPIAEAMSSGCPVITTNKAPMTEVGGKAAFYIKRYYNNTSINDWANQSAVTVDKVVQLSEQERKEIIQKGYSHTQRFNETKILDEIEDLYKRIDTFEEVTA